ncbi:hypothetical protein L1987_55500 [Smallanthus sonchifolius]|uniref:Uncharacterized protein n=1 Tax=Smallanthus sonchifolius TaxID=185202 RepID=A0ACB9E9X7_9ASTR|nr:hypothetical protein L1987_55500 [Smallanthus sonchifolius]
MSFHGGGMVFTADDGGDNFLGTHSRLISITLSTCLCLLFPIIVSNLLLIFTCYLSWGLPLSLEARTPKSPKDFV